VLIGGDEALFRATGDALRANSACLGVTDSRQTLLAGQARFAPSAALADRVRGLLLDSNCDGLLVSITPAEIEAQGFPLDRCSLALVSAGVEFPAPLRKLVEACAERLAEAVTPANAGQAVRD